MTDLKSRFENNVRKTIVDENPVNPKYYEHMSILLDELITLRRQKALDYKEYLEKIRELSSKVLRPNGENSNYPESINTNAKRALYDNLDQNEELADKLDAAVRLNKQADWQGHLLKERKIANTFRETFAMYSLDINVEEVMALIKAQPEYK